MPQLVEALESLTKDRPEDPIQYIGEYMLKESEKQWNPEEYKPTWDFPPSPQFKKQTAIKGLLNIQKPLQNTVKYIISFFISNFCAF